MKQLKHLTYRERLRELGLSSLQQKRLREVLISVYEYLIEGSRGDGARLFSLVPRGRPRGNGHKLKYKKFCLSIRLKKITVRMTEHWKRPHRGTVESPRLEVLKTQVNTVLSNLL